MSTLFSRLSRKSSESEWLIKKGPKGLSIEFLVMDLTSLCARQGGASRGTDSYIRLDPLPIPDVGKHIHGLQVERSVVFGSHDHKRNLIYVQLLTPTWSSQWLTSSLVDLVPSAAIVRKIKEMWSYHTTGYQSLKPHNWSLPFLSFSLRIESMYWALTRTRGRNLIWDSTRPRPSHY